MLTEGPGTHTLLFHTHSLFSNILTLFLHNLFFHTLCYTEEPITRPLLYIIHTPLSFHTLSFQTYFSFSTQSFFSISYAEWRGWPQGPSNTTTYTCFRSIHTHSHKVYKLLLCWRFVAVLLRKEEQGYYYYYNRDLNVIKSNSYLITRNPSPPFYSLTTCGYMYKSCSLLD